MLPNTLTTTTIDESFSLFENRTSSTSRDYPNLFREVADFSWTKKRDSPLYVDSNLSSTALDISRQMIDPGLFNEIEDLIINTIGIEFDDDIVSNQLDVNLYKIIDTYGSLAITVIDGLLDSRRVKFLQAVQLLSHLGVIRHLPTNQDRTFLLEKNLYASSKYVRDGASLGLLYLENPSTISFIKDAIDREPSKLLKENLIQVVNALEKLT